ncbi:MAG: hypothetical protein R3F24_07035 [Gammaproteobacteria bacterium]
MPNVSTMKPFKSGDIFAGATLLNRADDDHSGDRIFQFDSNLKEKGVLWTAGTTHLIGGLAFRQTVRSGPSTATALPCFASARRANSCPP